MSESSEISPEQKLLKEIFEDPDVYFTVAFKRDGTIKRVAPPPGKKVNESDIIDNPITHLHIDAIKTVTILSDPRHSPCCIVMGGVRYCWC
jgi:hypothetical protein